MGKELAGGLRRNSLAQRRRSGSPSNDSQPTTLRVAGDQSPGRSLCVSCGTDRVSGQTLEGLGVDIAECPDRTKRCRQPSNGGKIQRQLEETMVRLRSVGCSPAPKFTAFFMWRSAF